MAQMLYIGADPFPETAVPIFSDKDFVDLVREYLGLDAANYLSEIIEERDYCRMRLNET